MILEKGEKIHVIQRRLFESEPRRHFIGEITEIDQTLARVVGYAFIFDNTTNQYVRRPEKRTRLIGLADSGLILNIIPLSADLESAKYTQSKESKMMITDGKTFTLDINEFGSAR